jgi:hypothetical protein
MLPRHLDLLRGSRFAGLVVSFACGQFETCGLACGYGFSSARLIVDVDRLESIRRLDRLQATSAEL